MPDENAVEETKAIETEAPQPEAAAATTAGTAEDDAADAVKNALKGVDVSKLSRDDVFSNLIQDAKVYAFRLMVSANLLEQIMVREGVTPNESEQPVQPTE